VSSLKIKIPSKTMREKTKFCSFDRAFSVYDEINENEFISS
jgi:hypothetical protein